MVKFSVYLDIFIKNMLEKKINLSMLPSLPPIPSSSLWENQGTDHFKDLTESRMQTKGSYQFLQVNHWSDIEGGLVA